MPIRTKKDSWADVEVEMRGYNKTILDKIDEIIVWKKIERTIRKKYKKEFNVAGKPAYPCLAMFKILIIQNIYGLSDPEMENQLHDRISFVRFVGFSLASELPDYSTICRFRNVLLELGLFEKLFEAINLQIAEKGLIIKKGAIVDATIIESSRRPRKTVKADKVDEDRDEDDEDDIESDRVEYSDDAEARFLIKGNKIRYGYKGHVAVDEENGFIIGGHVSSANRNDGKELENVVLESQMPEGARVLADKGYAGKENSDMLKSRGYGDFIMKKGARNRALTDAEKAWNKEISKVRYKVERCFGTLKRGFGFVRMRYVGIIKAQMELFMKAIVYNLKKCAIILTA